MRVAAIVLAAGRGRRMGADKMRLDFRGRPLPAWAVLAAAEAGLDPVIAVLAPDHDDLARELSRLGARTVVNPDPDTGMAGSVRCGIGALGPEVEAVAILLGDMPLVSASVPTSLTAALDPQRGITIAAPVHEGRRGNPVVFHRTHFGELAVLEGDKGARDLFARYRLAMGLVPAGPEVHVDLDTPDDLARA